MTNMTMIILSDIAKSHQIVLITILNKMKFARTLKIAQVLNYSQSIQNPQKIINAKLHKKKKTKRE